MVDLIAWIEAHIGKFESFDQLKATVKAFYSMWVCGHSCIVVILKMADYLTAYCRYNWTTEAALAHSDHCTAGRCRERRAARAGLTAPVHLKQTCKRFKARTAITAVIPLQKKKKEEKQKDLDNVFILCELLLSRLHKCARHQGKQKYNIAEN